MVVSTWNPPENQEKADSCSVYLILDYVMHEVVIPLCTVKNMRKTKGFLKSEAGS